MTAILTPLSAAEVQARITSGRARLVDIREPDEFAREHIPGVAHTPLSAFEDAHLGIRADQDVIFMCRSGMRTQTNCVRLAARVEGEAFVLDGGLQGWKDAGLPTSVDKKAPLELMRQVQIIAGSLVVIGALLSWLVHPAWIALSAFVGAGLFMAGATGICGMARMLMLAPWNRTRAA
ncbi:rhodanese family protein [Brevundimonas sp. BAL450]|jgi:rhodanese-related sulfurtransferase|nr:MULTISPECIES: rhodanese family protein [Brevundimonas]MBG7615429.1 rhodanese family protein [Brevundimonas sp. BAL450]